MMKVSDIMTHEVVTIRNFETVAKAAKLMQQRQVQALIVEKSHDLDAYGVISAQDIVGKVIAYGLDPKTKRVFEIMNKPCVVLNPDLGIEYAARLLTDANLQSAPVIQSELLGILSITDILEHSNAVEQPQERELVHQIQILTNQAHQICRDNGPGSSICATAWSKVDALQAEFAHQRAMPLTETASEIFWGEYPEAFQNREYDAWCGG